MKTGIHPDSRDVAFVENSTGYVLIAKSTLKTDTTYTHEGTEYPSYNIEISSQSHPFYTGEKRILKTGAVDKFYARQKKAEELQKAQEKSAKKAPAKKTEEKAEKAEKKAPAKETAKADDAPKAEKAESQTDTPETPTEETAAE